MKTPAAGPKRRLTRIPEVDVRELRESLGLTVEEFALSYGFTVPSVKAWEDGSKQPYKVARVLLAVIASHPEMVDRVLAKPDDPLLRGH